MKRLSVLLLWMVCGGLAGFASAQEEQTVSLIPDRFYVTLPLGWEIEYDNQLLDNFLTDDDLDVTVSPALVQRLMLPPEQALDDFLLAVMTDLHDIEADDTELRPFDFGGKPGEVYLVGEYSLMAAVEMPDDTLVFVDVVATEQTPLNGADFDVIQELIASMGVRGIGTSRAQQAAEPCYISAPAGEQVRLRVGPGFNRGALTYLPGGDYLVLGQAEDEDEQIWFKLNKDDVAPERSAREVWVQKIDVEQRGGCNAVADAFAAPLIPIPVVENGVVTVRTNGIPPGEGDIVPVAGGYTLSYGTWGASSCMNGDQRAFAVGEEQGQLKPMSGPLQIWEDGASFTFEGIIFEREAVGSYLGQVQFGNGKVEYFRLFPRSGYYLEGQRTQNISAGGDRCSVSVPITLAGG